jgi:biopolymer transport protein ExbD
MKKKQRDRRRVEGTEELNLIPVMNLFVCLVPFLLLTAAFVQFGAIDMELPKAQAAQVNEDERLQKRINLIFIVDANKINVSGYRSGYSQPVESVYADFSHQELEPMVTYLQELAAKEDSEIGSSLFKAEPRTRFEDAIKVLNAIRKQDFLKSVVLATDMVD